MLEINQILRQAYILAENKSDDPVTKNGAIIINADGKMIGEGANRLPFGIRKESQRLEQPAKYEHIIHAEQDAIASAARQGKSTQNAILFCPWAACTFCARLIIQAGIIKVVTHKALMSQTRERWRIKIDKAMNMLPKQALHLRSLME